MCQIVFSVEDSEQLSRSIDAIAESTRSVMANVEKVCEKVCVMAAVTARVAEAAGSDGKAARDNLLRATDVMRMLEDIEDGFMAARPVPTWVREPKDAMYKERPVSHREFRSAQYHRRMMPPHKITVRETV